MKVIEKRVAYINSPAQACVDVLAQLSVLTGFSLERIRKDILDINPRRLQPYHRVLVLVGAQTWKKYDVQKHRPYEAFYKDIEGATRIVVLMHCVDLDLNTPVAIDRRISQRSIFRDIISICDVPLAEEDVRTCLKVVRDCGDDISYWTRKIADEIELDLHDGRPIERIELGQLMGSYARDIGFIKQEVPT